MQESELNFAELNNNLNYRQVRTNYFEKRTTVDSCNFKVFQFDFVYLICF